MSVSTSRSLYRATAAGGPHATQILAHKGGAGLMPENTLEAYRVAVGLGVDVIDCDLAMTADGVIVVSHDQSLNPAITRVGGAFLPTVPPVPINSLTADALAAYDVGAINPSSKYGLSFPAQRQLDGVRIPHLAEVIAFLNEPGRKRVRLNVEIKVDLANPANPAYTPPERMIEALLDLLGQTGMNDRTEVQCFDWTVLELLGGKREAAGLTRSFLSDGGYDLWMSWFGRTYGTPVDFDSYADLLTARILDIEADRPELVSCWQPYYGRDEDLRECLTAAMVATAHARGLPVVPWTLYDDADVPAAYVPYQPALSRSTATLLAKAVDGVLTNRPDIARGILAANGVPLPPVPRGSRRT